MGCRGHVRDRFLGLGRYGAATVAHNLCKQEEYRGDAHGYQGELPG